MPAHECSAIRGRGAAGREGQMKNLMVAIWLEAFYQSFRAEWPEYVERPAFLVDVRKAYHVINRRLASSSSGQGS